MSAILAASVDASRDGARKINRVSNLKPASKTIIWNQTKIADAGKASAVK
jgi:hypothetical protein